MSSARQTARRRRTPAKRAPAASAAAGRSDGSRSEEDELAPSTPRRAAPLRKPVIIIAASLIEDKGHGTGQGGGSDDVQAKAKETSDEDEGEDAFFTVAGEEQRIDDQEGDLGSAMKADSSSSSSDDMDDDRNVVSTIRSPPVENPDDLPADTPAPQFRVKRLLSFSSNAVNVGANYQANVPPLDSINDPKYIEKVAQQVNEQQQVWSASAISDEEYDSFVKRVRKLSGGRYSDTTLKNALQVLVAADYKLERALQRIAKQMQMQMRPAVDDTTPMGAWTSEEIQTFENLYTEHQKAFHKYLPSLPNRSTRDIVLFYYYWKKSRSNDEYKKRRGAEMASSEADLEVSVPMLRSSTCGQSRSSTPIPFANDSGPPAATMKRKAESVQQDELLHDLPVFAMSKRRSVESERPPFAAMPDTALPRDMSRPSSPSSFIPCERCTVACAKSQDGPSDQRFCSNCSQKWRANWRRFRRENGALFSPSSSSSSSSQGSSSSAGNHAFPFALKTLVQADLPSRLASPSPAKSEDALNLLKLEMLQRPGSSLRSGPPVPWGGSSK